MVFLLPAAKNEQPTQDLQSLQALEKTIRRESLAFLSLVQKMKPEKKSAARRRTVEKGKVVRSRCQVYDTLDEGGRVLYSPRLNEEFTILDREDAYCRVRLADGREGWIEERCLQAFSADEVVNEIKFAGVANSEIGGFMELADKIYAALARQNQAAAAIYAKYRPAGLAETGTIRQIRRAYTAIGRYFRYGDYFYQEYIRDRKLIASRDAAALAKLSAWAELFLGTANHASEAASGQSAENRGGSRDIVLGASYALRENSQLEVAFSDRREIIQTPFGATALQAGYSLRPSESLDLHAAVSYNTYRDEVNDLNDFSQLSLKTDVRFDLSPKQTIRLDYTFTSSSFANDPGAGFANHALSAGFRLQAQRGGSFHVQLRTNLETSDSAFHQFVYLAPSLGYERQKAAGGWGLKFAFELLSFRELELKNFNRLSLSFDSAGRRGGSARNAGLALIYKTYAHNEQSNYLQLGGKYTALASGRDRRLFSVSVSSNLFTAHGANSHSELRLDYGGDAGRFFSNITLYGRFWHRPQAAGSGPAKPHVIDLYAALGLRSATFKIGPVLALHAQVAPGEGVSFFKKDGNLFRVGALAEGSLKLPARGSLTVNAAYEYGFVYNDEIAIDLGSGSLTTGDVVLRHPTTFRVSGQLAIPILARLEFASRVSFYKIATDMDPTISINPIAANRMFLALCGIRYRYN
jgi:hypothetical protein